VAKSGRIGDPVTIKDVADRAGVALSSVSRVLTGHPDVSEAMRRRVQDAAAELDYTPDFLAQSLRLGATKTVGFVLRDISNPLFANIARRCERVLRQAGYAMVITSSDGDSDVEAANLALLRRRRVDGVIISLVSETARSTRRALDELTVPIVLLDREVKDLAAGAVLCDHYSGVRRATEELLARGHRDIGLITGSLEVRSSRERQRGYVEAHEAAQVPVRRELMVFGEFDADFAKGEVVRLLSRTPQITGLLTGGFGSTTGGLRALRQLRLEPGKDVSLIALDEWPTFDVFSPWLSSVTRDSGEMGAASAQLLLDMLDGSSPRVETVDTMFIPRESHGAIASVAAPGATRSVRKKAAGAGAGT
jgi:LacI family transcriptional regulator